MLSALALALTASVLVTVQQARPVLRGTWIATVGQKQTFRGTWSGTIQSTTPNAAQGSWTLLDNRSRVLLEGTWSARKSSKGWEGTWSAQIAAGRTSRGRSFTGTWQADIEDDEARSLAEMLERTLQDQIGGSWRSGRLQGNWWLKGSPQ